MLSQDEINALLSGMNTGGDDTSDSSTATTTIPEDNANDNTDGGCEQDHNSRSGRVSARQRTGTAFIYGQQGKTADQSKASD